uniref:Uncharacterized protein n=1 Tax=Anguilla anguilla TaxID=7936 RepID=A0A0E9VAM1_ANGAN
MCCTTVDFASVRKPPPRHTTLPLVPRMCPITQTRTPDHLYQVLGNSFRFRVHKMMAIRPSIPTLVQINV